MKRNTERTKQVEEFASIYLKTGETVFEEALVRQLNSSDIEVRKIAFKTLMTNTFPLQKETNWALYDFRMKKENKSIVEEGKAQP